MIERVYEPSHIRRGRLATQPTWFVTLPNGEQWRFNRKKDAVAFESGGEVPKWAGMRVRERTESPCGCKRDSWGRVQCEERSGPPGTFCVWEHERAASGD